ncbi:site-specific DNA-methyltransferase [Candidatus Saccharibacteria bacterium]|nr:site-specific DNA-methyltransferase [Candidatus Saccharibacteria bacterium]
MAGDPLKKGRYTKYSNKIGLYDTKNGNFIGNSPEVVLSFPFKDSVLEAGMTKEDAGREERFLNIEIDSKDIDTLEDPKVLTNFRYIDKDGEKELDRTSGIEFFDENGELKQNLLIKGNNLLALYTLREKLAGQVKLIYIDPPFYFIDSKATDSFRYNSNFKLSTWLTFMKNRLEAAYDLLKDDGIMMVHVGVEEQGYLNVLMDEVFGHENMINHITMTTTEPTGFKAAGKNLVPTANNLFIYRKSTKGDINKLYVKKGYDTAYNKVLVNKEEDYTKWTYKPIRQYVAEQLSKNISDISDDEVASWAIGHSDIVFQATAITGGALNKRKDTVRKSVQEKDKFFKHPNDDIDDFYILNGRKLSFFSNIFRNIDGEYVPSQILTDVWSDISWTGIANEGGVTLNNGKKPEKLMRRVIELATNPGDIVMDYHAGSGTTLAVAHKMNRRWIGVEQMDYIKDLTEKRLVNVINGDQTGVSKIVGWNDGGSFVYFELKKFNQEFIDRIMEAITIPELEGIYEDMQKNAFLKFFFDKNEFEKDENFRSKNLDERKQLLVGILDENQFYLNLSEMGDSKYKVSNAERVLTEKFYQISEDEVEDAEE